MVRRRHQMATTSSVERKHVSRQIRIFSDQNSVLTQRHLQVCEWQSCILTIPSTSQLAGGVQQRGVIGAVLLKQHRTSVDVRISLSAKFADNRRSSDHPLRTGASARPAQSCPKVSTNVDQLSDVDRLQSESPSDSHGYQGFRVSSLGAIFFYFDS